MKNIVIEYLYKLKNFFAQQWKGALVGSVLSFVIIAALGGVIENYAVTFWFEKIHPWLFNQSQINNLIFVLLVLVLLIFIAYFIVSRRSADTFEGINISAISSLMLKLRDEDLSKYQKLMGLINSIIQENIDVRNEDRLRDILKDVFQAIFKTLGPKNIDGAGLLLREEEDLDWIYFFQMNASQSQSKKRFFIGADEFVSSDKPRGVAGYVYLENRPDIVTIFNRSTGESDNPRFHMFDLSELGQMRYVIPYRSFICLPVRWKNYVVAVLSIENQELKGFDEESKIRLQPIADQLGFILYLYGKLEEQNSL